MASKCRRDGFFVVMDVDNGRSAMGKPTTTKPKRKCRKVKAGEMTASGRLRQGLAAKVRPIADQTNWRKKLQASRIKFDDEAKEIFLAAFAEHGRKFDAALAAGVGTLTVSNHCKNDPDFAQAYDEAKAEYRDKFVAKAIGELAYEGILIERKIGDDVIETKRDYPIRLIELELKRIDSTFRDKQEVSLTGGGGVLVVPAAMTPAEWVADQARKNEARKNPLLAEEEAKAPAAASGAGAFAPKEVHLPDRAADVAARKVGKAVTR